MIGISKFANAALMTMFVGFVLIGFTSSVQVAADEQKPEAKTKTDKTHAPLSDILNFHEVSDSLYTAGQVLPKHIDAVAKSGVEMVINLAPASEERNAKEGFLISQQGISYVQIPVNWDKPTDQDLSLFFAMMDARAERKTLVHCFANYRGSAFTYLYRVLKEGVDETVARKDLHKVWDADAFEKYPQWRVFIDKHLKTST